MNWLTSHVERYTRTRPAPEGNVATPSNWLGDHLARYIPPPVPHAGLGEGGQWTPGTADRRSGPAYENDVGWGGAP